MDDDERFGLKGGRRRGAQAAGERKYLGSVLKAWSKTDTALSPRSGRPRFAGTRIGRGAVAARALTSGARFGGFRARQVFVKCRVVRFRANGIQALRCHFRYLQRDGATRNGEPGRLYCAERDDAYGNDFIARCTGDRHHFRLVVAADDGTQYEDLSPLVRRFMARMEEDLQTGLEWVAANHADTLFPHTHIVLRGTDDLGEDLIIAPAYIYHGMRQRLCGLVSLDLGPPTDLEDRPVLSQVEAERLTHIDRRLLREADDSSIVRTMGRDPVDHAIRAGRLRKLESLGLASELGAGRWQLADDLEPTLRRIEHRHEVARIMQRTLKAANVNRAPAQRIIHCSPPCTSLTGRMVARGLSDEIGNVHYLIIDGADGRSHYVEIGDGRGSEPLPERAIVRIEFAHGQELCTGKAAPSLRLLSPLPLEQLAGEEAATWLDEELCAPAAAPRDQGFGREVRTALAQRRAWLIEQGLASFEGERFQLRPDMLADLKTRGFQHASAAIARETGLVFKAAPAGSRIEGVFRKRLDLAFGRFAVIEDGLQFSLVPWRPVLARAIGERVNALVRPDGEISWTIGRGRAIEL